MTLLKKLNNAHHEYLTFNRNNPTFLIVDQKTWMDILNLKENIVKMQSCYQTEQNYYFVFKCKVAIIEKSTSGEFIQFS